VVGRCDGWGWCPANVTRATLGKSPCIRIPNFLARIQPAWEGVRY
jgi:hypothetical protein